MGRPGQPAELGLIYVQLAAKDASYLTGQVYGLQTAMDNLRRDFSQKPTG